MVNSLMVPTQLKMLGYKIEDMVLFSSDKIVPHIFDPYCITLSIMPCQYFVAWRLEIGEQYTHTHYGRKGWLQSRVQGKWIHMK